MIERFVREVQEHVMLGNDPKHVRVDKGGHRLGRKRLVPVLAQFIARGQRRQIGQVQRSFGGVHVVRLQVQSLAQKVLHLRRCVVREFQPHRLVALAAPQFPLDGLEQIVLLVFVHRQIKIARHAEAMTAHHAKPGKQLARVHGDDVLEQNESGPMRRRRRNLHQALQNCRNLHDGEDARAASHALALLAQNQGQVEAAVAQDRKGMPLVHCQRREHRPHVAAEVRVQESRLLGVELLRPQDGQPGLVGQLGRDELLEVAVQGRDHVMGARGDRRQLLSRQHPVGSTVSHAACQQLLESRDPHHEEFVQIGRHDALEFAALGQRDVRVTRFLQDAPVEFQPGQLAIDEVVRLHVAPGAAERVVSCSKMALGRQGSTSCLSFG